MKVFSKCNREIINSKLEEIINQAIREETIDLNDICDIALSFASKLIHHTVKGLYINRDEFRKDMVNHFDTRLEARFMLKEVDME